MEKIRHIKNMRWKKQSKHAQISLEIMIVIGISLVAVASLIYVVNYANMNKNNLNKTQELLLILASTIDEVYESEQGTYKTIIVDFPPDLEEIYVEDGRLIIKVNMFNGISESTKKINAPIVEIELAGIIKDTRMHKLKIEKDELNRLMISTIN